MKVTKLPGLKEGHKKRNAFLLYCYVTWIGLFVYLGIAGFPDQPEPEGYDIIVECTCEWNGNLATKNDNEVIAGWGKETYFVNKSDADIIVTATKETNPYEELSIKVLYGDKVVGKDINDLPKDPAAVHIKKGQTESQGWW